jgi:formylglycine-generating enzyme required for sulfatase activity
MLALTELSTMVLVLLTVPMTTGPTAMVEPVKMASASKQSQAPSPGGRRCPKDMAYVPGGSFRMGDRGDQVTVAGYCLDVTEVTVAAYARCVSAGSCSEAALTVDWAGITDQYRASDKYCNGDRVDRQDHPVNCVDWNQSDAYCAAQGKRLSTEPEWEWAARGGSKARTYPWGNAAPAGQVCWDGEGSDLGGGNRYSTCPVGGYAAGDNPQGIHDLAGNVWEWTASFNGSSPARVERGGSWDNNDPAELRTALRLNYQPTNRDSHLGFRCARKP